MTYFIKTALVIGTLALGACTNADRFDSADAVDLNAQAGAGGINQSALDPSQNPTSPQYFSQTIGDRVLFENDSSLLTAQGRATLDGQAGWLGTNSDYLAVIEGHADEKGTREYNLALGARRANAVREYLISKGVASSRIRTVSYGKERPLAVCSEESCYAQNRRAVTIISIGQVS
ncbi:peptidoglycan-associated lipoprotein Pal [Thalassorhabdomicrobium marinisediminis]|uniref:Peptidoglycan-associated lipoprotein n=1 Tax=Thalassorhabdomicrobium marinisediminis TaxID=2170577 RepID=A0A2T7FUG8_9RHOB|nr:peptidoglycan-associated lipoprotein Pal [Thalassorhabdomicrobium marinisediminis]PVA05806.1 peptidoglycan-associated lipoprotein Pal [Thalassorhabdomicrobium marinisediminis]